MNALIGLTNSTRARCRQAVVSPLLTALVEYAQREWSNPMAAKTPALAYGPYTTVQDWKVSAGVPPIEDGVRMSLLSSSPWSRSTVACPSERDKL